MLLNSNGPEDHVQFEHSFSKRLRALGGMEHLFWLFDQNRSTNFAIAAEITGRFASAEWLAALNAVRRRHPLLSSRIATDQDGNPHFWSEPSAAIPLRVTEEAGRHWSQEVAVELHRRFDPATAPLVRAVVMQNARRSTLILVAHHAVADGMGGAGLIADVLSALSGAQMLPLPLVPSLEALLAETLDAVPPQASPPFAPVPKAFHAPDAAVHIDTVAFSRVVTSRLIDQARSAGTTVHGAITAAAYAALRDLSAQHRKGQIRTLTPMNVRFLSDDVANSLGVHITLPVTINEDAADTAFWDVARSVRREIVELKSKLASIAQLSAVRAAMSTRPSVEFVADLGSAVLAFDLILTNLGNEPIQTSYGAIELTGLWGPMVTSGFADDQVIGACTSDGRLRLTLTSRAPIKGLLEQIHKILTHGTIGSPNSMIPGVRPDAGIRRSC